MAYAFEALMLVVTSLEELKQIDCTKPPFNEPIHLTLGNFDGVHLGHKALLQHVKNQGTSAAVTFQTHPAYTLFPESALPLLSTYEEKVSIIASEGIDLLIALDFKQVQKMPYDTFLRTLYSALPFASLSLGEGAQFGYKRKGTKERLIPLAKELGFTLSYLPKISLDGLPLSSGEIRKWKKDGKYDLVDKALGRLNADLL